MAIQRQRLDQKQQMKQTVSMQTVQFMRLLEIPSNRLEDEIFKAVDENPALEVDYDAPSEQYENDTFEDSDYDDQSLTELHSESTLSDDAYDDFFSSESYEDDYDYTMDRHNDYMLASINQSKDDVYREPTIVNDLSLQESLISQLNILNINEEDRPIAEYLIGNIDDDGYITQEINAITMDLLLTYNIYTTSAKIEYLLTNYIQTLDPPGVGARNLQECILLQLQRLPHNAITEQAITAIQHHFNAYSLKHYDKIKSQLQLDDDAFKKVIDLIHSMSPKPADNPSRNEMALNYIIPDFTISIEDGKLSLSLNNDHIPRLRVNKDYTEMLNFLKSEKNQKSRAEAEKYYKEHIENAANFINALTQRELTMFNIMYTIMMKQENFFLSGDDLTIKPMILKDIAEEIGIDISTVSRVTNNKYVLTPYGTLSIKRLFSESIGDDDVSSIEVKAIISQLIGKEDKSAPLTDERLCAELEQKGYKIARRTVAKYREQLNIPVARLRK
ncbi:MAG: RNA polymerase factor sigma-54 [Bacteroidales bacterium]|jgi:RNA polymerase sigma-54 factor|nr:RNA polymerase factor sigma-54 [Bacteroidales bacterium]